MLILFWTNFDVATPQPGGPTLTVARLLPLALCGFLRRLGGVMVEHKGPLRLVDWDFHMPPGSKMRPGALSGPI